MTIPLHNENTTADLMFGVESLSKPAFGASQILFDFLKKREVAKEVSTIPNVRNLIATADGAFHYPGGGCVTVKSF